MFMRAGKWEGVTPLQPNFFWWFLWSMSFKFSNNIFITFEMLSVAYNRPVHKINISLLFRPSLIRGPCISRQCSPIWSLIFQSYSGGTRPWNRKNGQQDMSDGLLEVVAIDNLDLAILHAGGSGASVCQCRKAIITTKRPIPMQVSLCFGFFPHLLAYLLDYYWSWVPRRVLG